MPNANDAWLQLTKAKKIKTIKMKELSFTFHGEFILGMFNALAEMCGY